MPAELFTPGDLTDALQEDVDNDTALIAERVARGWLRWATQVDPWPEPHPEELFAWALILGGAYYANPARYVTKTTTDLAEGYGQISDVLAAAREWGMRRRGEPLPGDPPATAPAPRFSFPRPAWGETGYVSG